MSERVGVVGLGRMGAPIAERLVRAGVDVSVFDVREPAMSRAADGAERARCVRDLAESVDVVVTVLPGSAELDELCLGSEGMLAVMRPGSCLLDLTSTDPRVAQRMTAAAISAGLGYVGAPMTGGPEDAAAGSLKFFVGGDPTAVGRVNPLLEHLCRPDGIHLVGSDAAAAYTAKLLANALWFGQAVAVTETLLLGQALGIDPSSLLKSLRRSAADSVFLSQHAPALLRGDYLPAFGLDRVVEELDTVAQLADSARTPARLTSLVASLHREALALFGPVDGELMVAKLFETTAGRALHDAPPGP